MVGHVTSYHNVFIAGFITQLHGIINKRETKDVLLKIHAYV